MTRASECRPEQRIQAQVNARKEAKLGWVKQGWKASRKEAKERTRISGIRGGHSLFHLFHERYAGQKKLLSASCVPPAGPGSGLRSVSATFESRHSAAGLAPLPASSVPGRGSDAP